MDRAKKIKILHLENNGIDAELVAFALKEQSYHVDIYVTDEKDLFCKKLDKEKYDLILMDYDTPELSASDAITLIKAKKIKTPIIIISGPIGYQKTVQLIKQGAFDYVLKENLAGLADTVSRALKEDHHKTDDAKDDDSAALKVTKTGVFRVDIKTGHCLSMNGPLCQMLGYTKEECGDEGWLKCIVSAEKTNFKKEFERNLKSQLPFEMIVRLVTKKSNQIWVRCNCIPEITAEKMEYIGVIVDITHLKKTEDELVNLSMHDVLTGLPNRRSFAEAVQAMVNECERGLLDSFAVFYMDLDRFKTVNDMFGHQCGDELLKQAAARFKSSIRQYDIISRIGGDEFLLVFKHVSSIGEIAFLADNLLNKFRVPFYIGEHECLTTLSIGAVYVHGPIESIDAESIIQKADQALYRAKARGRNCYEIYTDNISHEIQHTAFIENALRHAIAKDELKIFFQPEIDLLKSNIFGFEVLLRWQQPVYGDISPGIFIPIAEESGQMKEIGGWVIDAALNAFENLFSDSAYFRNHNVSLSVNISPMQLLEEDFIDQLIKKMKSKNIVRGRVIFELTETGLIQNVEQLKTQFNHSAANELFFAVDDFGTGYSSFTHLKELPIKIIKIDQSFVQSIQTDANCKNIIKSIITLAKSMDITLIAEGVETQEQVDFLYSNGCHILQGYFFSEAIPLEGLAVYMQNFKI